MAIIISFVTFALMKFTGDPLADLKLNPAISEAQILQESKRLGLDKNLIEQYRLWFSNLLCGDLGLSQNNQKVINLIRPALFNTFILNLIANLVTWSLALSMGILAAIHKDSALDNIIKLLNSILMSCPSFILGILVLLFALNSGLLPIGGITSINFDELNYLEKFFDLAKHLVLPVFVLTILGFSSIQRQMRANFLDVLDANFIRTARAKGLKEFDILLKHALPNSINPLITIFGYEFAGLFAGAAITEMIFSYPGLGYLTLEAARKLDINLVLANLLLGSSMLILGNLFSDLLLIKLDPRTSS